MSVSSTFRVELLGGFRVFADGSAAPRLPTARQQQLIAFLILHARSSPIPRQRIAGSLWPESNDAQALTNLLSNSFKFIRNRDLGLIEVGGRSEINENVYYVKDNGAGFNEEYADKLFNTFQRLHSPEEFEGIEVIMSDAQLGHPKIQVPLYFSVAHPICASIEDCGWPGGSLKIQTTYVGRMITEADEANRVGSPDHRARSLKAPMRFTE